VAKVVMLEGIKERLKLGLLAAPEFLSV